MQLGEIDVLKAVGQAGAGLQEDEAYRDSVSRHFDLFYLD